MWVGGTFENPVAVCVSSSILTAINLGRCCIDNAVLCSCKHNSTVYLKELLCHWFYSYLFSCAIWFFFVVLLVVSNIFTLPFVLISVFIEWSILAERWTTLLYFQEEFIAVQEQTIMQIFINNNGDFKLFGFPW